MSFALISPFVSPAAIRMRMKLRIRSAMGGVRELKQGVAGRAHDLLLKLGEGWVALARERGRCEREYRDCDGSKRHCLLASAIRRTPVVKEEQ